MIIACHHITKEFVEKTILSDVTFHLEKGDRAAIVGINGAGKTTLLRIMAGEMEADSGTVTLSGGARLGYLAQDQGLDASSTIYEEALEAKRDIIEMERQLSQYEQEMEAVKGNALNELIESYTNLLHRFEMLNGYAYKGEITGVLRGLGFEDSEFDKQISTLSGGQKTRVALARLLLQSPDVIMLDEPTNHLDLGSIRWLENYLTNYRGTSRSKMLPPLSSPAITLCMPKKRRPSAISSSAPGSTTRPRSGTRRRSSPNSNSSTAKNPSSGPRAVKRC